jgi:hypothetical protein
VFNNQAGEGLMVPGTPEYTKGPDGALRIVLGGPPGFRVKFDYEKTVRPTPNTANIQIYNLHPSTEAKIKKAYDDSQGDVTLWAGYLANPRIVFRGTVRYVFTYKDGTDWITEVQAADGDKDHHSALVNLTLQAGQTPLDLVHAILDVFQIGRTNQGGYVQVAATPYLRGKTVSAPARTLLDRISADNGANWSIQDGALHIVEAAAVLPSEAIIVNSDTGMLGAPEITGKGIMVKMLLNPQVRCNGAIKIDNNSIKIKAIQQYTNGPKVRANTLARVSPDGVYKAIKIHGTGDTRDNDWTTEATCIGVGQPIPSNSKRRGGVRL